MRPSLEEKIKNWATEIGIEAGEKVAELKKDEWLAEGTQKGYELGTREGIAFGTQKGYELGTQEGIAFGTQKGIELGKQSGIKQGISQTVRKMIDSGKLSLDDISAFSGLTIDEVKKIAMAK